MADDENIEEQEVTVSEIWQLVKPVHVDEEDEDVNKPQPPPKIGKLVKFLNDIEDQEELDTRVREDLDPVTQQSLLMWATLNKKFVLVEWLIKKCKRNAFAFSPGKENQLAIFDKWVEVRKELADREHEKSLQPPQEEEEEEEEREPEAKADQLVFEALSEYHDDWGTRGLGLVKLVGELGVYQGARSQDGEYVKEGEGRSLYPNSDMYCGEYRNNQRNGLGTYWFASSGMIYTGQWRENVRDGVGRMVYPDGGRYFGNWSKNVQNGDGHYTYPDGSSYVGAWEDGVKNGFGTYTFTDGSQFIGAFVGGQFLCGEWRMSQGSTRYYGSFYNDSPIGSGVFIFKHGTDNSFRQEGVYVNGMWSPVGPVKGASSAPQLRLIIQKQEFTLAFTEECGAFHMEQLVHVSNFGPFIRWARDLSESKDIHLERVEVSSIKFNKEDKSVEEVKLKIVAKDPVGKRLRNTDGITLSQPSVKLMVMLISESTVVCLLNKAPSAVLGESSQISLPTVRAASDGCLHGDFVRVVEPAARIRLHKSATKTIFSSVFSGSQVSSASQDVIGYIQHIHSDAMQKLQERLDESSGAAGFNTVVAVRLGDVPALTSDAITLATISRVRSMINDGCLPTATVEAQRPPTPLPPVAEPRPDIEPLLEAERQAMAARKAAEEDE